jgi:hypothetical protein
MPRGIKRNWFAVEASFIDHPKWMALSWDERGKWLAVRALAERQPTACFKDATHLSTLLMKEGDPNPTETIERLTAVRLLDITADGCIVIHDMADYDSETSTGRVQRHRDSQETDRNGPKRAKRLETATHTPTHTSGPAPATPGGARAREERTAGETLKDFLTRIGAPIPDVATVTKETSDGETNGTEGRGDDDGKGRSRPRRRAKAPV